MGSEDAPLTVYVSTQVREIQSRCAFADMQHRRGFEIMLGVAVARKSPFALDAMALATPERLRNR